MIGNFYESKRYKLLLVIPLLMFVISLYFITKIQLDSSLRGGINIQVQTNSTVDVRQLTATINSRITGAEASVARSPGGISITIAENSSISSAQISLLRVYASYSNYSRDNFNVSRYQSLLNTQPDNKTAQDALAGARQGAAKDLLAINDSLSDELRLLAPFLSNANTAYNQSNPDSMLNTAKNIFSNSSVVYKNQVVSTMQSIVPFTSYSYNEITPTLGAFFLTEMTNIIIAAFVLVAITVFFVFRTPLPAFAVVFGATNDLVVALGAMGLFGIPLGVASIGGLLMLIGYSIDTDMLAAIRILKRTEGTAAERAFNTMKTGVTMTFAAIISFLILFVMSYIAFIPTYFEISGVVLVGLIGDLATTWLGDMIMILWYKESKQKRVLR